jgi:PAS domain S-box-containing protein
MIAPDRAREGVQTRRETTVAPFTGALVEEVRVAREEFALFMTGSELGSPNGDLAVEDRERVLRALMGRIPAMIYRCADDEHWTMEFVSAGAEELTGYRPEELVGNARLPYSGIVVPWHYEGVCHDIAAAIEKHNAWTTSYPIITATGERKWVWERGVAVLDDCGEVQALEGIIVDMTAEREVEEDVELALAEWRQIFDAMDDAVMVLEADGTVVRANAAAAALCGRARGDVVGMRCCELFHGLAGSHPECPRERALTSGRSETSYIAREGRLLRFAFRPTRVLDGRASGGIHVVSDVTDLAESLGGQARGVSGQ